MKMIRRIFFDDISSLAKNFFALVIAVGVCLLPALYAWFNIYSNWDPYGNTGALKLAAVSLDEGYTDDDGEYHNQGDAIIENLHENTSVDWQFVDTEEEAKEGVYSGEYYAAVVISKEFSYNMYNVFSEDPEKPTLIFYENQKKNPVATKISDTVISTLQNNINEAFIETVFSQVFETVGTTYENMDEDNSVSGVVTNLQNLHNNLTEYEESIQQIIAADAVLKTNLDEAKSDSDNLNTQTADSATALQETSQEISTTKTTLSSYNSHVNDTISQVQNRLSNAQSLLAQATLAGDAATMENALNQVCQQIVAIEQSLNSQTEVWSSVSGFLNILSSIQSSNIINLSESQLKSIIAATSNTISKAQQKLNGDVIPEVNTSIDNLQLVVENAYTTMDSLSSTFGYTSTMLDSLVGTVNAADSSLQQTAEALDYINTRIQETLDAVDDLTMDESMEAIINNLSNNAEAYGKFFSQPVEVETEAVYPIENYGSAVAPFYTTLAVWVGALILTAIVKVHPDKKKYQGATNVQLFFGRYALYWVMAQFQAVVIVFGDVVLFGIQCLHPGAFLFATSVTATVFSLFIYSLVVTWGDVGKALSVVIVVIQIAGSSGTYPIELLPEFFQKVYIFFPFPYAINAMREAICGFYEMDYAIYLLELSAFILVALVIGIFLKIPFTEINHYMEERMEETEMM